MTGLWSSYSERVKNHIRNPRNVGVIKNPDGFGYVGEPARGIDIELYLKVEGGIITDAKFKLFGCGASIATTSMVTEVIKGKSIAEAQGISKQAIVEALAGLPQAKMYVSALVQEALKAAIDDHLSKSKKGT